MEEVLPLALTLPLVPPSPVYAKNLSGDIRPYSNDSPAEHVARILTQPQEREERDRSHIVGTGPTPDDKMWDFGEDNRGPEMAIVALVVTSLSCIAVGLRCYTMLRILKRFLVEDWLAVLTCVSF